MSTMQHKFYDLCLISQPVVYYCLIILAYLYSKRMQDFSLSSVLFSYNTERKYSGRIDMQLHQPEWIFITFFPFPMLQSPFRNQIGIRYWVRCLNVRRQGYIGSSWYPHPNSNSTTSIYSFKLNICSNKMLHSCSQG